MEKILEKIPQIAINANERETVLYYAISLCGYYDTDKYYLSFLEKCEFRITKKIIKSFHFVDSLEKSICVIYYFNNVPKLLYKKEGDVCNYYVIGNLSDLQDDINEIMKLIIDDDFVIKSLNEISFDDSYVSFNKKTESFKLLRDEKYLNFNEDESYFKITV